MSFCVAEMPKPLRRGFGDHVARAIDKQGWQLMLFPSQARINRIAMLWSMWVALIMAIAAISLWAIYQRRRRLQERLESRDALRRAAQELDATIAVRTQELRVANQALEGKYVTLQQTESLLRSTQNELVQAGFDLVLHCRSGRSDAEAVQDLSVYQACDRGGTGLIVEALF